MEAKELRHVRAWIVFVIFGLLISGVIAFPLQHEIQWIARVLQIPENASPGQCPDFFR